MAQVTIDQAMQLGIQNHQAGRLAEAEQIYRQVLTRQPNHAEALHLLGVIAHRAGQLDVALELIRRAIAINPVSTDFYANLGNALRDKGRIDDAIAAYQHALQLKPDLAEAHNNLGIALSNKGLLDQAITAYRRALQLKPNYAEAHNNLGNVLSSAGALDEAVAAYGHALRLRPGYAEAHYNMGNALRDKGLLDDAIAAYHHALQLKPDLAEIHNNLGNALRDKRRFDEAIVAFRHALRLKPDYAEAHHSLGHALREKGLFDDAITAYRETLRLKPDNAEAHNSLGVALVHNGLLDEATAAYRQALRLNCDYAEAQNNLGVALVQKGLPDEAIAAYRQALRIRPDYADAHYNLSLAHLLKGDFLQGWPEYEWRWRWKNFPSPRREFVEPLWNGKDLNGQTILLHAEQGMGDTIQFVRYVPMVANRGGKVALECQPELLRLLQGLPGVEQLIPVKQPLPHFDVHCPLLTLPLAFDTRRESIPAGAPYLKVDVQLKEFWAEKLGPADGRLRVGLVWSGNPEFKFDRTRSITQSQLAPLGAVQGVAFHRLQKGRAAERVSPATGGMQLIDLGPHLRDFADTAAVISLMDLVISTDTAAAHLAGALAAPIWVMLQFMPDWRWQLERDDCPWYPTMRLFRQKSLGNWDEVIERVAQALGAFRAKRETRQ
jgi:tetratricopeptide (TPR) repeat protein